jgi:hypothetical protein
VTVENAPATEPNDDDNDGQSGWTEEDETRWRAEVDAEDPPWLARLLVRMREERQAELADEAADELANRRAIKNVIAVAKQLTPSDWARWDADMAVFEHAHTSLNEGREALERGDLHRAAYLLGIAAAHGAGDSILFLAATYRALNRDTLAAAWLETAAEEGYDEREVERLARIAASRTEP